MNQQVIKEKIFNIERDLEFLKRSFLEKPDFDVDEKNWQMIRAATKKVRKKLYQKYYGIK